MKKIIIGLTIFCIILLNGCTQSSKIQETTPSPEAMEEDSTPIEEVITQVEDIPTEEVSCGNGVCEIYKEEDIAACEEDCKKLGILVKERKIIDFFPKSLGEFEIMPFENEYYNYHKRSTHADWIDHSFGYLGSAGKYVLHQYVKEKRDYHYVPVDTILETNEYHAQYSKGNKEGYTFNIWIKTYTDYSDYKTVEDNYFRIQRDTLFTARSNKGNAKEYKEPKLGTKIVEYTSWYFYERDGTYEHDVKVFIPEIKTTIWFDFSDRYWVGEGVTGHLGGSESRVDYADVVAIVHEYIMWLADDTSFNTELSEEYLQEYKKIYRAKFKEVEETGKEAIKRDRSKTILYVTDEDWKVIMNLDGFEDVDDGQITFSRFLYQQRESDNMIISVFAEKIKGVKDSESCREYYYPSVEEMTEDIPNRLEGVVDVSQISESKRGENALLTYETTTKYQGELVKIKSLNTYAYHDEYCFDFHLSQVGFEGDMEPFYDILDSVQFVKVVGKPFEVGDIRYVISPTEFWEKLLK